MLKVIEHSIFTAKFRHISVFFIFYNKQYKTPQYLKQNFGPQHRTWHVIPMSFIVSRINVAGIYNNNNIYLKSNIHSIIRYKFSGLYYVGQYMYP